MLHIARGIEVWFGLALDIPVTTTGVVFWLGNVHGAIPSQVVRIREPNRDWILRVVVCYIQKRHVLKLRSAMISTWEPPYCPIRKALVYLETLNEKRLANCQPLLKLNATLSIMATST